MILSPREVKLVLRTLLRPSDSIRPMDVMFCFVVLAQLSNPLRVLSKTQPGWIMNIPAVGLIGSLPIILAMNYWPLVIGLVMRLCRYLCLYTLRFTLYTKSDSDHASKLSPYSRITSSPLRSHFITCQRQCFDADATGRCRSGTK